jgi:hypothetical protein
MLDAVRNGLTVIDPDFGHMIVDAKTLAKVLNRIPVTAAVSAGAYEAHKAQDMANANRDKYTPEMGPENKKHNGGIFYK